MQELDEYPAYLPLIDHSGRDYVEVLGETHAFLRPRSYLEVGVNTGTTLKLANCVTLAVDPSFNITTDIMNEKPKLYMFQLSSDEFFAHHEISALLEGPLALGFLDGLHHAEFLLRDFMNAEKYCDANSVLVLHDCIPVDTQMARRNQVDPEVQKQTPTPKAWTGDVWKTLAILKAYRPDLCITCLDAAPTGLVYVTALKPESKVLSDHYDAIVDEMAAWELSRERLQEFIGSLDLVSTTKVDSESKMKGLLYRTSANG